MSMPLISLSLGEAYLQTLRTLLSQRHTRQQEYAVPSTCVEKQSTPSNRWFSFVNSNMATQNGGFTYTQVPYDVEKGEVSDAHWKFAERTVRIGFIRKVFGLLGAQLALTALVASAFVLSTSVQGFVGRNPWILSMSMIASFALILTFTFSEDARRKHPLNLVLLFAFTLTESILVGAISASYDTSSVVLAAAMTAGITIALAVYAFRTKNDFTTFGGVLFASLVGLILLGIVGFFVKTTMFNLLVSGFGAILFSGYIVFDVQMLVGGEHKFSLSPDEYVFGAIAIYLDIINLFIYLLRIFGSRSD